MNITVAQNHTQQSNLRHLDPHTLQIAGHREVGTCVTLPPLCKYSLKLLLQFLQHFTQSHPIFTCYLEYYLILPIFTPKSSKYFQSKSGNNNCELIHRHHRKALISVD
jgi:hypothetical protein